MAAERTQPAVDVVALAGTLIVLTGAVALPFVELRANRLVAGIPRPVVAAGPWALLLAAAVLLGAAAALWPRARTRRALAAASAWGVYAAAAWGLGAAATTLLAGRPVAARVSIGAGAWTMLAGAAVLGFGGRTRVARGPARRAAVLVALVGVPAAALRWGGLARISLAREYVARAAGFWPLVGDHVALTLTALALGTLLGLPLGLWAAHDRRARGVVLGVTGVIQTVPSLALLGLLIVPLSALSTAVPALRQLGVRGIGAAPALVALTLYALLPIVRGTCIGLTGVDAAALDAARGMGMSRWQRLTRVRLPLAAPLLIDGIRTAAVLLVGIVTLTVFAGARNLGVLVFEGLGQFAPDLILLGSLPIILLAVLADAALSALGRVLTPEGVRP